MRDLATVVAFAKAPKGLGYVAAEHVPLLLLGAIRCRREAPFWFGAKEGPVPAVPTDEQIVERVADEAVRLAASNYRCLPPEPLAPVAWSRYCARAK